jgi:hypothetical protein
MVPTARQCSYAIFLSFDGSEWCIELLHNILNEDLIDLTDLKPKGLRSSAWCASLGRWEIVVERERTSRISGTRIA